MSGKRALAGGLVVGIGLLACTAEARLAKIPPRKQDPYLGAIVMDAATGQVLFEERADARGYPASVIKLMNLLLILEQVERGQAQLTNAVLVTAEAAGIGGSQTYLKESEVFTVDELLYAMIVKSGNDAAAALAIHLAGSRLAFVERMNRRAVELGLTNTVFHSVHGLPPDEGQLPDVSSARDLAILARELLTHPQALVYTTTRQRMFRSGTFRLDSHNRLLGTCEGCDGLKTGYFLTAGFTIAATAQRNNRRVIAVVLGSLTRQGRDARARELLAKGFALLPPLPPPGSTNEPATNAAVTPSERPAASAAGHGWLWGAVAIALVAALAVVVLVLVRKRFTTDL